MKTIIANLKMNLSYDKVKEYVENVNNNIILCPSFIYLPYFKNKLAGAQDCFYLDDGSYTSYISPLHLKQMGINYVIIGHSERRNIDTDEIINKKILAATRHGLQVIFCIGENLDDNKEEKLKKQISIGLQNCDLTNILIAYEPVWAIGTGLIPKNNQIETTSQFIKEYVLKLFSNDIKVLYGGSVDVNNIQKLNKISTIDGFLVGKASIDYNVINKIYDITNFQ